MGTAKITFRVLFLEISDPEFQFWAIDPQQKWPEHIVNASYCSSYVDAFLRDVVDLWINLARNLNNVRAGGRSPVDDGDLTYLKFINENLNDGISRLTDVKAVAEL